MANQGAGPREGLRGRVLSFVQHVDQTLGDMPRGAQQLRVIGRGAHGQDLAGRGGDRSLQSAADRGDELVRPVIEADVGLRAVEPELVEVMPWGIKERLLLEKTAVGFFLSGHLFDAVEREGRQFARCKIDDLIHSPESMVLAGIVSALLNTMPSFRPLSRVRSVSVTAPTSPR